MRMTMRFVSKSIWKAADYRENDIEQLLVYFTFRYIMNSIYDSKYNCKIAYLLCYVYTYSA